MSERTTTILIVDDEPHVIHVVRLKFEQCRVQVITANNGKRGYELACEHRPDLVVTDFEMPGGTGLEMAKSMRVNETTAEIPIIMLTARGHRAPLAEIAETSVRSVLAKPFSPRHLVKKADELLGGVLLAPPPVRHASREGGGDDGGTVAA
jgi:two-component system phosphate regulon response regulator PhoB